MSYRVILDRGILIRGECFPHGAVVTRAEAGLQIEELVKAGHIEEVKESAAKPAGKPAAKPAEKEG